VPAAGCFRQFWGDFFFEVGEHEDAFAARLGAVDDSFEIFVADSVVA